MASCKALRGGTKQGPSGGAVRGVEGVVMKRERVRKEEQGEEKIERYEGIKVEEDMKL